MNPISNPSSPLPLAVAAHALGSPYHLLWQAVLTRKVPASRIGSRWFMAEADLPAAAKALGLKFPAAVAKKRRATHAMSMA